MRVKAPLPVLFVVAIAAGAGAIIWIQTRPPANVTWQGYVDADYVRVGPTLSGALTAVPVQRGDRVARGELLFTQDDGDESAALDQARKQLDQAQQVLANLEAAGKKTEIAEAQANLADVAASRAMALANLKRGEELLPRGAATVQSVDQMRADFQSAEAKVNNAEAALTQILAPLGRPREITAQAAAVQADRAALAMAQWRLDQRRVTSPVSGTIDDVLALPGETLAAGAPVVSILAPENILVRFFVPEPALASIHAGEALRLSCDGCPADLSARVSFISPQAEYTPPVIYSDTDRQKLVYLIEARPQPDRAARLHPGEPVDVAPLAEPAR